MMTPRHALVSRCVYVVSSRTLVASCDVAVWTGSCFIGAVEATGGWQLVEAAHADDGGDVTAYDAVDAVDSHVRLTREGGGGWGTANRPLLRALLEYTPEALSFWKGPLALPEAGDPDFYEYEYLLLEPVGDVEDDDFVAFSGRPC